MKRLKLILLPLLLLLLLAGCGGSSDIITSEGGASPDVVEDLPGDDTENDAGFYNPLTGLAIDEEHANRRPFAVMLNNLKSALPQQGNSQADIIYEVLAEGGITRMLGLYQSVEDVEILGSIRSARPYYIELALGHDAIYVHAGGSEQAYADLKSLNADHMDGVQGVFSSEVFWRDRERVEGKYYNLEHSLVTSGEKLETAVEKHDLTAEHTGYDCGLTFREDGTPENGEDAQTITVPYSSYKTGVFTYDAERGLYLVSEYGSPYVDGNTGEQIEVTNVLVLKTACVSTGDSAGHITVALESGEGWYACGGKVIPILWSKGGADEPLRYTTADGTSLELGVGKSYVNIIPLNQEVTFE